MRERAGNCMAPNNGAEANAELTLMRPSAMRSQRADGPEEEGYPDHYAHRRAAPSA